jgi:hypothetical protein
LLPEKSDKNTSVFIYLIFGARVFQLSKVEVEADYGLTYYGKLQPFKDFDKQSSSARASDIAC